MKGKQFLLLIKHPPCYAYIQIGPVKGLALFEERQLYQARVKDIDFASVSMILRLDLGTILSIFVMLVLFVV